VPIVLAVNSRALEAKGNRDISQLIDAASARAIAQQGSMSGSKSTADLAMDVPGWRRFVPTEHPFNSDTSGEGGTAASGGIQHKEEVAGQSPRSRQQHFSAEPRQSVEQRLNQQAGSGNSPTDATDARDRTAKHREAVLREFLRWREQMLLSH
jgi:hypothetical protein